MGYFLRRNFLSGRMLRLLAGARAGPLGTGRGLQRHSQQQSRSVMADHQYNKAKLGKFPITNEQYLFWKGRANNPGGVVVQEMSGFQQKVMFQYWWMAPQKWYYKINRSAFSYIGLFFFFFLTMFQGTTHAIEMDIRSRHWW